MSQWTLSVVSDELGQDFDRVVTLAAALGFQGIALNQLWNKEASDLTQSEVNTVKKLFREHQLRPTAYGTLCFKPIEIEDPDFEAKIQQDLDRVKRSCDKAVQIGAPLVRVFSLKRSEGGGNPSPIWENGGGLSQSQLEVIVGVLTQAAAIAQEFDLLLGVENVRSCYGNTGENLGTILDAIHLPNVRAVWDPTNHFVSCGRPIMSGFAAISSHLYSVDVKNAKIADPVSGLTEWQPIGEGEVDYAEQLEYLHTQQFSGPLTVETHWRAGGRLPADVATAIGWGQLRYMLKQLGAWS